MISLDAIDIKIIAALQREGRMTKVKLAETVNLSVSPCWERLRRLEREGVISGYRAEVELAKLGPVTMVWVEVSLEHHQQEDFDRFENHVSSVPEIIECWATGGTVDYIMRTATPHMSDYQDLMERLLKAGIGIQRYNTFVVTKQIKRSGELPLKAFLGRGVQTP